MAAMTAIVPGGAGAGVDSAVEGLVPAFENAEFSEFAYVATCEDGHGSRPATASIVIPMNPGVLDESSNAVAFAASGVASKIKHGDLVAAYRRTSGDDQAVFVGEVTGITHDAGGEPSKDAIYVDAMDARLAMRFVRVEGRWIKDNMGTRQFQQGWAAHFNPGGRPNCIFLNGNPYFAQHPDFGLSGDDQPPDPSVASETKACYWTLFAILTYLRNTIGPPDAKKVTSPDVFPWLSACPDWLVWPEGFGSGIDSEAQSNFDSGQGQNFGALGSSRKGRDLNARGMALAGVPGSPGLLDILFEAAGGWSWTLDYNEGFTNTLRAVPTMFGSAMAGASLPYAPSGAAADALGEAVVTRATYKESSENMATRVSGAGHLMKVETRVANENLVPANSRVIPAWTAERFRLFRMLAGGNNIELPVTSTRAGLTVYKTVESLTGTPGNRAWEQACSVFPEVLTQWKLAPEFDFQVGTMLAELELPFATISRPVLPSLLSFLGSETGARDSITQPMPVVVEVDTALTPAGSGIFDKALETDGLDVWDNGTINMHALREIDNDKRAWNWASGQTFGLAADGGLDIFVRDIRMTVAIPTDHRLVYSTRLGSDESGGEGGIFSGVTSDSPDIEKVNPRMSRSVYVDLATLYELWLRHADSYPLQESQVPGSGNPFGEKSTLDDALRNDLPGLQSTVRRIAREKARLTRSGEFVFDGWIVTEYPVGTPIESLTPVGGEGQPIIVRCIIGGRRWITVPAKDAQGNTVFKASTALVPM